MSVLERIVHEPALFFNDQIARALEHELEEIIMHKHSVTVSHKQLMRALLFILTESKNRKKVNAYARAMLKEVVERLAKEETSSDK